MDLPASVANKRLTAELNPLAATLTKNTGVLLPSRAPNCSEWGPRRSTTLRLFDFSTLQLFDDFSTRVFNGLRILPSSVSCNPCICHSYENCRVYTKDSHSGTPRVLQSPKDRGFREGNSPLGVVPALCSPIEDAMKRTLRHLVPFFIVLLLFCLFAPASFAQESDQPTIRFVRNPDPAPEFNLAGLDGKPVTLADTKGKVVLVNFWATWCGPCRAEIPDLVELQNKYKDRLQILGLVVDDEDQDTIKKFVAKFHINYPVAIATDALRLEYGGIPALPTSFVLDSEGRVVQKHEGLRDPVLYETEVRSLLGFPIGDVKVETFEDTGEIFLKHADRASELPGVDLSKLTPEQKTVALHKFNADSCTCGCQYTLAQCRIYDRNCQTSKAAITKILAAITKSPSATPTPASVAPALAPSAAPTAPAPPASSPTAEKPHE
jgi:thiol-disulfide isomerase/thioredoxin